MASQQLEARALDIAENTPEQLKEHEQIVKGFVRTRFPPEPNGYLHVGHAKSMNLNFEGAFDKLNVDKSKRFTYLRYDDTNPEAEKKEYIDNILADVTWLGWKPDAITYSSEYFPTMYQFALQLIRQGDAYVCHQTKDEIEKCRSILRQLNIDNKSDTPPSEAQIQAAASPYRSRSVEDNLADFERMRRGEYDEKTACLRLKFDLTSPNPNLWDPVAYRVKYVPHPHIGDAWCIYPTYDYTHCIVDALEHIDYSICTLEFETRRESYYLLLDKLGLYKPKVYEFARLNLTYTVISKRKFQTLLRKKLVRGWDDPRMPTLSGLRRRGFNAEILNAFCKQIGVTRVQSTVQIEQLHALTRRIYGETARRYLAVLNPIEVVLTNYDKLHETFDAPDFPQDPSRKEHTHGLRFTKVFYIDASDFRQQDEASYYGLAPNKQVSLKYTPYNITCTNVIRKGEKIVRLEAELELKSESAKKPKGNISWVGSTVKDNALARPRSIEVRLYDHLFSVEDLENQPKEWEEYLNPQSEVVWANAMVDNCGMEYLQKYKATTNDLTEVVQFERLGYFVLDNKDNAHADQHVLNRVVGLKATAEAATPASNVATSSRKELQDKQMQDKLAKMKINPKDMFLQQTDKYSAFDADGIPTHDQNKEPLSKSLVKKLKKEAAKQKSLYEKYLKQQQQ